MERRIVEISGEDFINLSEYATRNKQSVQKALNELLSYGLNLKRREILLKELESVNKFLNRQSDVNS